METEQSSKRRNKKQKFPSLFRMKHPGNCPGKVSYAEYEGYMIRVTEFDISYGAVITSPTGKNFYITEAYYHTLKRFAFQILKNKIRKNIIDDMNEQENNNLLTSTK